ILLDNRADSFHRVSLSATANDDTLNTVRWDREKQDVFSIRIRSNLGDGVIEIPYDAPFLFVLPFEIFGIQSVVVRSFYQELSRPVDNVNAGPKMTKAIVAFFLCTKPFMVRIKMKQKPVTAVTVVSPKKGIGGCF